MPARLQSLDVFRGLVVALLVLVEWVLPAPGYTWLRHSPWEGIRIADVVFPAFLFMVGASASLGLRWDGKRLAKRTIVLVVLGLLFNAWGSSGADLAGLRFTGVLQMIAVAGLVVGLVTRFTTSPVAVGGIGLGLAALHGALLSHAPISCGTGSLEPGCSLAWSIDSRYVDAAHLYRAGTAGHDPEGILTTVLGATAVALLGWAAGRFLYRRGERGHAALIGAACLVAAGFATLAWPLLKRVWTPSFGLLLAGGCTLVLVGLAVVLDRRPSPLTWPFAALGRNALLVYVGQHVVLTAILTTWAPTTAPLTFAVLGVAAWWAVAAVLHALDWHWTV